MTASNVDRGQAATLASKPPEESLLDAYSQLARIREFEERALELRTAREIIGPVHPYIGQEAIAVGVCAVLTPQDAIVSHYRGHGHCIARGTPLPRLAAELFGRATGLCGGKAAALVSDRERNVLISSGIVGAGVPIAAGAALALQIAGQGGMAVVFFGDGALGCGVVHETLNIAVVQRLPLLFVCEHNQYQGATRTEDVAPELSMVRIARGHGMTAESVDGNDVEAVVAAAGAAAARACRGEGPTFLEARTYLTRFHLQFDKPSTEHRPEGELAMWMARDPLTVLRDRLTARGVGSSEFERIEQAATDEVATAIEYARTSPWPDPRDALLHAVPVSS